MTRPGAAPSASTNIVPKSCSSARTIFLLKNKKRRVINAACADFKKFI